MSHHDNDRIDIDYEVAPPDRLDAYHRRQLSAMLDGELSPDQARFMLRRLQHDADLAARWERWQVCGDVLRGRGHALLPPDFSQRVAAAIASGEPGSHASAVAAGQRTRRDTPRPQGLLRWGGGALAASVALVALFMARPLPEAGPPGAPGGESAAVAAMAVVESAPVPASGSVPGPAAGLAVEQPADPRPAAPSPTDATAAALLASAAPAALAVSELPRRASERGTRSQAQRAALRRSQVVAATGPAALAPAAAQPLAAMPVPYAATGPLAEADALFGDAPAPGIVPRPWPRAVLPGLSGRQPYAAGYGLPQADAFAPFQPRFESPPDRVLRGLVPPAADDRPVPIE